jgi:hypothetical protein
VPIFNDVKIIYTHINYSAETLIEIKLGNLDSYQLIVLNAIWTLYFSLFFLNG